MLLKTQCTNVVPNAALGSTLYLVQFVGRAAPKFNLGRLVVWLAAGKVAHS
jgi:hypothetical protein